MSNLNGNIQCKAAPLCWVKVYELKNVIYYRWFKYFTFVYNTYTINTICNLLHWHLIKQLDGKWICISVALFQSIDQSKHFTTLVTPNHTFILWCHARCQSAHQELFVVQYLAQGCFDIQMRELGIQTINPLNTGTFSNFYLKLRYVIISVENIQKFNKLSIECENTVLTLWRLRILLQEKILKLTC